MQELIKIERAVIGIEETNAVNAKDLYESLEIKKDFSHWIKAQIERAGLRVNVDFITYALKGVGGQFDSKEYVLTTDASKHIAMMSQGQKAQEVRDYFIAVEKQATSGSLTHSVEMEELKAGMKFLANQLDTIMRGQASTEQIRIATQIKPRNETLSPAQMDKLKVAIHTASRLVAQQNKVSIEIASRMIYAQLNAGFNVDTYYKIRSGDFGRALAFVQGLETKAKMELNNVYAKMSNDIAEAMQDLDEEYDDEEEREGLYR